MSNQQCQSIEGKSTLLVTEKSRHGHTHSALAVRVEKDKDLPSRNGCTEEASADQTFAFLVPHDTNFHQFANILVQRCFEVI